MQVCDAMTREVRTIGPDASLSDAARTMIESDVGLLPVAEGEHLVGMISDRDIAVRGVAKGLKPDAKVGEVMSHEVLYCFADEDVEEVCRNMAQNQVRRLPVLDRDKRLVGIVTLSELAQNSSLKAAGEALGAIGQPGGETSQTLT
ncbi:MAG: CBS domain-containing protein [Hyphomonadaceae bacterium]